MLPIPIAKEQPELKLCITEECDPLILFETQQGWIDSDIDSKVSVDVIHDGWVIPRRFYDLLYDKNEIEETFVQERDWGAYLIANQLAMRLGLKGHYCIPIARVLMDYGRFPQPIFDEPERTSIDLFLNRGAFNPPFLDVLTEEQKEDIWANYYDKISIGLEGILSSKLVKIAIHTYDRRNVSGTARPPVSLLTLSKAYQDESRMPKGAFDRLYPDILGEFTADRVLTYRLATRLETAGIPVALNLPYTLPAGSVEVRSQVWFFFNSLKRSFEEHRARGGSITPTERKVTDLVWAMLLNTNSRSKITRELRAYIQQQAQAPVDRQAEFALAREVYEEIKKFSRHNDEEFVNEYRYSRDRPSSIAIEVRKDFLWNLSDDSVYSPPRPDDLQEENLNRLVRALAMGVMEYLNYDYPQKALSWRSNRGGTSKD